MLKRFAVFILIFLVCCPLVFAVQPIPIDVRLQDGLYIGKSVEYLNERDLFLSLKDRWEIEPPYVDKMLSGEMHTVGEMMFTLDDVPGGYRAWMKIKGQSEKERTVTWGIRDVVTEAPSLPFVRSEKTVFMLDFRPHAWWLRFQVRNTGRSPVDLYLQQDKHVSGELDLFVPDNGGWMVKRGDFTQKWVERDQPDKNLAFGFSVKPGVTTCYMRVDSWFIDSFPLRLWTSNGYKTHVGVDSAFQVMVIGGYLFIFIFNIFIFLSVRDISYIYLSLVSIAVMFIHLGFSGAGFQHFWPGDPMTGIHVWALGACFSYVFSLLFCRSFIDIQQIKPAIDRFVVYLVRGLLVLIPVYLIAPQSISQAIIGFILLIDYLFYLPVLFAAIVAVRRGNRSGVFLLIGIALHYLSLVEWILTSTDIIPYQLLNFIHIKGTSFLVIMTLGLADKISTMKTSLTDLNLNLEKKVRDRTEELAQKTAEIEEANEQLRELDQVKSRFFANISHEIRTPLTLLISPIESLSEGTHGRLPEKALSVLQTMHRNAGRLLNLVNDLLDFSKIEAGRMAVEREMCDISELLALCVAGVKDTAAKNDIRVSFTGLTRGLKAYIDRDLLEKAVFNLLSNAIKFNCTGGKVDVTLTRDGEELVIAVEDTGIGIPKDQIKHVFDRFAQVDASSTRKFEGTGIGLSLTREIVELHGGQVAVKSRIGEGAMFEIRLPLSCPVGEEAPVDTNDKASTADRPSTDNRPESEMKARILVVEDNDDMRTYLGGLMEKHYTIFTARNGKEALVLLERENVDLLLADVMMPEMDGFELVQAVRARPATEGLPIVLLTAKSLTEEIVGGIEKGANDYITKPFRPEELMARVRSQLKFSLMKQNILGEMKRRSQQKKITDKTRLKIETIRDYLIRHYSDQLSRSDLAAVVEMSPDHLGRMFKQQTGEKIADFLNGIRIEKASDLLKTTDDKVIAIAYDVGFESLRTFNKVFLDIKGMSPNAFRNQDGSV